MSAGLLRRTFFVAGLLALASPAVSAGCDGGLPGGEAVLIFDVAGAPVPRVPPLLSLTSEGVVAVRAVAPAEGVIRAAIGAGAAQALLREIVEQERFFEIDGDALVRATAPGQATGGTIGLGMGAIADAPTSYIELALPGCRHAVSFRGLALASGVYPDIEPLQRLRRIELRLLALLESARNG